MPDAFVNRPLNLRVWVAPRDPRRGGSAAGFASRTVQSVLVPAVAVVGLQTCFWPDAGLAGVARAQVGPMQV